MAGRTKISMTAALVAELDSTVFTTTGDRRVAQLSRLLQASVVFGTAPKARSARPESSLALTRRVVDLRPLSAFRSPPIESNT
jgi:hypothetical protein